MSNFEGNVFRFNDFLLDGSLVLLQRLDSAVILEVVQRDPDFNAGIGVEPGVLVGFPEKAFDETLRHVVNTFSAQNMSKILAFEIPSDLRSQVRPVKHRVALAAVKEETTGIIIMPSNANQVHRLGRVTAIGDTVEIDVKIGDIVIYQVNKMFELSITHFVGEGDNRQPVMIMHQGDTFAKLDSPEITLEKFHVLGDWVLVRDVKIDMIGGLHLPETAIPPPEFEVVQIGNLLPSSEDPVLAQIKVGDKIYVDKSRANQIRIEGKLYWYVLKQGIHGVRPTGSV